MGYIIFQGNVSCNVQLTLRMKYCRQLIACLKKIITALLKVINGNIKTSAYDDTAIKALIKGNTDAINTLNGTGAGSISQAVADGIATVVANAPDSFDTLKEIADWINTHSDSASAMNSQIKANKDDIAALQALIGQLPETPEATTIIDYIQKYVTEKMASSEDMANVKARLTTAETDIADLKATKFGVISNERLDAILQEAIADASTEEPTV